MSSTIKTAKRFRRGRTLRPGMINIRVPGEPLDHRTSEGYRSTGLNVDAKFVQRVASVLHGVDAESILRGPFVTTDRERSASLDRSLRRALGLLANGTESEPSRERLEESLVEWLSAVLGHAVPDRFREPTSRGSRHRAAVVRQAEEYMLAQLHRSLSLLEICEVVGASERTLLYAFRERTGQSPKAYLNALKLNRLRQDLKEADPRWIPCTSSPCIGAWCTPAHSPPTITGYLANFLIRRFSGEDVRGNAGSENPGLMRSTTCHFASRPISRRRR